MSAFIHATQLIESKATSLNQVAATFKKFTFKPETINLDYGGGRYDKGTELLAASGCSNAIYDPFNRTLAHNLSARLRIARAGGAHSATINNVLNVIAERDAQLDAISQAANGLCDDGRAYFLIHEGDRSGLGKATSKGWQRHEKARAYIDLLETRFGRVERKGNILIASAPIKTQPNLFDLTVLEAEIKAHARKLGVPWRSGKHGVGKSIGGCLYVHRSAWDALPESLLNKALEKLPKEFQATIAKWDEKSSSISFIESREFDTVAEPAIERALKVNTDGSVHLTPAKTDPQIYHHKWNFVRPDYKGFDPLESAIRSLQWAQIPCDRSRIGTRSHWESTVLHPLLGGDGAVTPPAQPTPAPKPIKQKA